MSAAQTVPSSPPETLQKILLVDDLEENLIVLEKIINPLEVEMVTAKSGDAALEAVSHHDFTVIILDVIMPGMNGYTLAAKLRKDPKTQDVPFIFITGSHPDDRDLLKGYELGATDYIIKPFLPEVLTRKVKILLEIDREIHELKQQRAELEKRESEHLTELGLRQKSLSQSRQTTVSMMEEAVQAKVLAEESAARYRMLFENMPSGFSLHEMIYDEQGKAVDYTFIDVNPAFETLTGLKKENIIGKTVLEVLPGTESHWVDLYAKVVETGEPAFYENYAKELGKYFNVRAFRPAPGRFAVLFSDVTEQRQTSENLKSSQRLLRTIIDSIPIRIFWKDRKSVYLGSNISYSKDAGFDHPDLLIGKTDAEFPWKKRHIEKYRADDQKVIQSGVPQLDYEERQSWSDGSDHWIKTNKIPLTDTEGKIIGVLGTYEDITEKKQMQEAIEKRILALTLPLEDSKEIAFDELFNLQEIQKIQDEFAAATNVASIITTPKGIPITRPSNFTDLCKDVIRGTEKGCANCIISDAELGRMHPSGPLLQPCLSGGLWDAGASITVGGKHIASWLIGQVRDDTQTEERMLGYAREIGADEKQFLEAFRRVPVMSKEQFRHVADALFTLANQLSNSAYQNIQQARFISDEKRRTQELSRLSTAIEQSPEVIVISDTNGVIEYANPAFERSTGYSCTEAIGQNPSLLKSGKQSDEFYTALWETLAAGNIWNGRFINKRKDGSLYTEEAVISPVKTPDGTITNYVAVKRDITQELVREEQMQQAQKMEAVGQLAGGIAHDFNNILQTIMGFSDLLMLSMESADEESRENVEEVQKAAQHAADLTRQLLTFSRKQHVEFSELNINDLVKNARNLIVSILGEMIQLETDLHPEIHRISADFRQLERTILNITINARDAMPQGGVLTVKTENVTFNEEEIKATPLAMAGEYVCFSIGDTGIGIPQNIIGRIFEPFFSTKAPGKGTGLGLAAIYGIIRKHNGWIKVTSEPGRGSIFKIYLPAIPEGSEHSETLIPSDPAFTREGTGQRILVVEDAEAVRKLSVNALEEAGYFVFSAESAEEAENLFEKEQGNFDLLFSDVILPKKNGADLAVSLRIKNPDLPVLLCSGYSGNRIEESGARLKDFIFLEKPFSMRSLLKNVKQILSPDTLGS